MRETMPVQLILALNKFNPQFIKDGMEWSVWSVKKSDTSVLFKAQNYILRILRIYLGRLLGN
jgi:hypothetical protein